MLKNEKIFIFIIDLNKNMYVHVINESTFLSMMNYKKDLTPEKHAWIYSLQTTSMTESTL